MAYTPTPLPEVIDVAGIKTEIGILGEGKPLLYLHSGDGANLDAPYIRMLAETYQVIITSHPGFGSSDLPPHFTAIDDLAIFYLDLIEQLELEEITLMGSSFGGWLAAELATLCGNRISEIVLAAPLGIKISGREERDITDLFKLHWADLPGYLVHVKGKAHDFANLDDDTVRRIVRNRESLALFGWAPTLYNPRLKHRLHRLKVPTLVMWGEEDRVINRNYAAEFAQRISGSDFVTIPEAGHYLGYDQPEKMVAAIERFSKRAISNNKRGVSQ